MASSAENRDIEMTAKLGFSLIPKICYRLLYVEMSAQLDECTVENVDLKMKEKRGVDGGIRS